MNTKNSFFKKIPYNLSLLLLTSGASLILGLLSFSGMYALIPTLAIALPILPFAFAAFGLSVSYEGEIYLQNIKGALKKLFKENYLHEHLAKQFLLENFPKTSPNSTEDECSETCPQFFIDYEKQLKLSEAYNHKKLGKEDIKKKKHIEKTLKDMEKWFARQLFPAGQEGKEKTKYARELQMWLMAHGQEKFQHKLAKRQTTSNYVKAFSTLSAVFMGLGSTYLIVEAFTVIPWLTSISFAIWPIVVPMALVAGMAYGLLTYNTITDLINNQTIKTWFQKIRTDLKQGLSVRNIFMASMTAILVTLALALTICTAGTWWTIATHAQPLFGWMSKMPSFIMGVINPIITGMSAVFFNIENTAESLELLDKSVKSKTNIFTRIGRSISEGWTHLRNTENWGQIFNPFRLILKLTLTPLRLLLFVGHLISIALTADRMPGVPQVVSALIAIISEGFEDAHYFIGLDHEAHDEEHDQDHHHECSDQKTKTQQLLEERLENAGGHNHDADIPTRMLKALFSPLYFASAIWDWALSKLNGSTERRTLTMKEAWNKQRGIKEDEPVHLPEEAQVPSAKWQKEHTLYLLDKYEKKHFKDVMVGTDIAVKKIIGLNQLRDKVRASKADNIVTILTQAKENPNPDFEKHRHSFFGQSTTATTDFVQNLSECVRNVI